MLYLFANTLICLATFFTIGNGAKEELDTRPENTAVLRGTSFDLSCGKKTNISSTYISWWSSKRSNIAINDEVVSGYEVAWERHTCNTSSVLTVVGDHDSSGTYVCHVTQHDVEFTAAAAEVIVVEQAKCSQTVTDIAVEGEVVEFTCEVKYDGHWAPILKWSDISSLTALVINETDKYHAKYKLATIIHRDMHMRPLTCNASFDENYAKYLPNGHARNTPSMKMEGCSTKPLDVYWPPSEDRIIIYPEKSRYESGERIQCTAEINPFANRIRWLDNNDEIVSQETLVTGQPGDYFYSCNVSNVVGRPGNEQLRTARRYFNFTVGPDTETQKPFSLRQQSNESAQNGIQHRQLLLTFLLNFLVFHIW